MVIIGAVRCGVRGLLGAPALVMHAIKAVSSMLAAHQSSNLLFLSTRVWHLYSCHILVARHDIGSMQTIENLLTIALVAKVAIRVVRVIVAFRTRSSCFYLCGH